jgi:S-DNA-T family DNA segregation ATPase FtsK/SpoIIIE
MPRYEGERISRGPVQLRPATWRVSAGWMLAGWLLRTLGELLLWMIRHPWAMLLLTLAVLVQVSMNVYGTTATLTPLVILAAALAGWRWRWPDSFSRFVWWPVKAIIRRAWVYRRGWEPAMTTCKLGESYNDHHFLPTLRKVRCRGSVDKVTVKMLPGQILDDYAEQGERLAMTFGAQDCRVVTGKRHGDVDLRFLTDDPLQAVVPPLPPADPPDLLALPVALREDGTVYTQQLLGSHWLIAGATGSGKSCVEWAILHALSPAIRSGLVQVWGIDPKGGMEFAIGQHLFARYCYGNPNNDTEGPAPLVEDEGEGSAHERAFAEVLEDAVQVMQARQTQLRGVARLHIPTPEEPLIVVLVDELASLTAYVNDRKAKTRIRSALSLLLSQGRAPGVSVIAALQDPRKDVLPFRDLFPARIALRMTEPEQVDMTLGDGYRNRGARCDRIPTSLPGVAYVVEDGIPEPARIRFPYLSDDHIQAMGRYVTPLRPVEDEGSEAA